MKTNIKSIFSYSVLFSSAILLAACGGGDGSSSNDEETGSLSLAITDGPVDGAQEVVVQFDGVEIQPASGDRITFNFDEPQTIDLLDLQGSISEPLLSDETVPAGEYNWVRLMVSAEEDMVFDSYIVTGDGTQHELSIPSGSQTGLQLNSGFTVAVQGVSNFTVDFDLRKSVVEAPGLDVYMLKPSLRLVDNLTVGTISGTIDANLISEACTNPTDNDGAVYLFAGEVETAQDIQGVEADPLTSALVDSEWNYEIGFVAEGDYSAAFTCENDIDDPEQEDELVFYGLTSFTVTADENSEVDFAVE